MDYNEKAVTRMMGKVRKASGPLEDKCWAFTGADASTSGHKSFHYSNDGVKETTAHRASYRLFNGPIPEGLLVRHHCDVACCVNPDHLELGTHSDNRNDRALRGPAESSTGVKGLYELGSGYLTKKAGIQKYHKDRNEALRWLGLL